MGPPPPLSSIDTHNPTTHSPNVAVPTLHLLPIPEVQMAHHPVQLTAANLKSNFSWGDPLSVQKPDNIFRMYGMNPNGFRLTKKEAILPNLSSWPL
jgi:hypothetical protein